jgi:hypothetical protein
MASSFPNGTIFAISTAFSAEKTVSAITNASTGVATATAHGFADGDILLLEMPSQLDLRVVRVDNAATNAFDIEGINTTSTTTYPSGFGAGTAKEVTTWVSLSQVVDSQSNGGEQQFYQWVYLEDGRQRQRPTFKNARSLTLTMDYDADLSWHAALLAADLARDPVVLRASLPNGSFLYYSMYVGFDGEPTFTVNENQQTTVSFAFASPFSTRYAS